jgi:hypothetical protein
MLATATPRLKIRTSASRGILAVTHPVFGVAKRVLRWDQIEVSQLVDPGNCRDFEATLFAGFDTSRNPIGD